MGLQIRIWFVDSAISVQKDSEGLYVIRWTNEMFAAIQFKFNTTNRHEFRRGWAEAIRVRNVVFKLFNLLRNLSRCEAAIFGRHISRTVLTLKKNENNIMLCGIHWAVTGIKLWRTQLNLGILSLLESYFGYDIA